LDLSQWTRVFEFANTDLPKALSRLHELHAAMLKILADNDTDLEITKRNTTVVKVAIRHANNQVEENISLSQLSIPVAGTFSHPFLANLCIDESHKAALEDFQETIVSTQIEREQESLIALGRHLAIPFVPQRTIEDQVAQKDHRV